MPFLRSCELCSFCWMVGRKERGGVGVWSNASSGMGLVKNCKDIFLELQRKKTHGYVIFEIDEKQKQVPFHITNPCKDASRIYHLWSFSSHCKRTLSTRNFLGLTSAGFGIRSEMGFVMVISLPLILFTVLLGFGCFLLGRAKGREEARAGVGSRVCVAPLAPPAAVASSPPTLARKGGPDDV
ncbi:hypothetical protein MUK42_05469 [Musa troglodytarum]|uniref:Uncharacterized protein n=1 Tax=Musa troglodytarum TaxID=320322 RepID=A0A9E7K9G6_9LILI|nr:hypothetical protein MUK42_05469 [Musa troglodytarum]